MWAQLEALQKLKLSNRAHITTALHSTLGQVKDARRELKEELDDSTAMEQSWQLVSCRLCCRGQISVLVQIGVVIDLAKRLAIAAVVQQPE